MPEMAEKILKFGKWFEAGCDLGTLFEAMAKYVIPVTLGFYLAKCLLDLMVDMGNGKRGRH